MSRNTFLQDSLMMRSYPEACLGCSYENKLLRQVAFTRQHLSSWGVNHLLLTIFRLKIIILHVTTGRVSSKINSTYGNGSHFSRNDCRDRIQHPVPYFFCYFSHVSWLSNEDYKDDVGVNVQISDISKRHVGKDLARKHASRCKKYADSS